MARPPSPSGRHGQAPLSLCSQAWHEAGELLVEPPTSRAAEPYRDLPLVELIARIRACHRGVQPPERSAEAPAIGSAQPDDWAASVATTAPAGAGEERSMVPPGLALALLEHPLDPEGIETLRQAADQLRHELVGETVTYVVNRNLNSSNICVLRCGFCAFRRDEGQEGAYRIARSELAERARQAQALGASELCLQAALDPGARIDGSHLIWAETLLQVLQEAAPGIHLHAFSPQELLFIAQADDLPLQEVLLRLQTAGLGSVPGTAAEVLSERVRRRLCPEKLSARSWLTVMRQVHRQGLAATSTLMAGHLETDADRAAHLLSLISLQQHAWQHHQRGFSEFVLLPFIGAAAPAPLRRLVGRDQPDRQAMLRLTAQARLLLGPWIRHHQPSWVKLTLAGAVEALRWGCDDIGGTLMEEHITTMAGARGGSSQTAETLRQAVLAIGRPVRQRDTLYGEPPPRPAATGAAGCTALPSGSAAGAALP
jgi:5-amino-6-(D-ribitylamino)uracil---L-tyrosine 4-hydroxyphenyl transferase